MDEVTFSKWRRVGVEVVSNMVSMDGKDMRPVSITVRGRGRKEGKEEGRMEKVEKVRK